MIFSFIFNQTLIIVTYWLYDVAKFWTLAIREIRLRSREFAFFFISKAIAFPERFSWVAWLTAILNHYFRCIRYPGDAVRIILVTWVLRLLEDGSSFTQSGRNWCLKKSFVMFDIFDSKDYINILGMVVEDEPEGVGAPRIKAYYWNVHWPLIYLIHYYCFNFKQWYGC